MPQVYWGFDYRTQSGSDRYAFANIAAEWASMPRAEGVQLSLIHICIAANKAKDHLKSAYHRRVQATEDDTMALMAAPPGDVYKRQSPPRPLRATRSRFFPKRRS